VNVAITTHTHTHTNLESQASKRSQGQPVYAFPSRVPASATLQAHWRAHAQPITSYPKRTGPPTLWKCKYEQFHWRAREPTDMKLQSGLAHKKLAREYPVHGMFVRGEERWGGGPQFANKRIDTVQFPDPLGLSTPGPGMIAAVPQIRTCGPPPQLSN
jgi:hypothetical protein